MQKVGIKGMVRYRSYRQESIQKTSMVLVSLNDFFVDKIKDLFQVFFESIWSAPD